jgi:NAD(P)H-dependent FMN reductase
MSAKIVLLAGSSRVDSQSAKVAHYLAERLQARGAQCRVLDLGHGKLLRSCRFLRNMMYRQPFSF